MAKRVPVGSRYVVYGLVDPRTGKVCYVGRSSHGVYRAWSHWYRCGRGTGGFGHGLKCELWVRELRRLRLRPEVRVLQRLRATPTVHERLDSAERVWIRRLRRAGAPLTNVSDGGLTPKRGPHSRTHCERISKALRGRKLSTLQRLQMSVLRTGKLHSVETRRRMSVAQKERRYGRAWSRMSRLMALAQGKPVLCVEDSLVFPSLRAAARHYRTRGEAISESIRGRGDRRPWKHHGRTFRLVRLQLSGMPKKPLTGPPLRK